LIFMSVSIGTLAALVYTLRLVAMMDKKLTALCEKQGIKT